MPPNGLFPKLKTNADAKMGRWSAGFSNSKGSVAKKKLRRGGFVFLVVFVATNCLNIYTAICCHKSKVKQRLSKISDLQGSPATFHTFQEMFKLFNAFQRWLCCIEIESGTDLLLHQLFAPSKYLDLVIPLSWECLPENMGRKKEAGILFQTVKSQIQNIANIFHLQEFSQFTFSSILHIFT